jgi:hypothetical protein
VKVTINDADIPAARRGVSVPAQVIAVPSLGTEQTSKSCGSVPELLMLNVALPRTTLFVESV